MSAWVCKIPSKTFLVGEYCPLFGGKALTLATQPSFVVSIEQTKTPHIPFHANSPAGMLCQQHQLTDLHITFDDPHRGQGGLGASSAQFLGMYLYLLKQSHQTFNKAHLIESYHHCQDTKGILPSGADLIGQYFGQLCQSKDGHTMNWPFSQLGFMIVRTGNKLATHEHLKELNAFDIGPLNHIVDQTELALQNKQPDAFIQSIRDFQQALRTLDLMHPQSADLVTQLQSIDGVYTAKGCGAQGADTILLITAPNKHNSIQAKVASLGLALICDHTALSRLTISHNPIPAITA